VDPACADHVRVHGITKISGRGRMAVGGDACLFRPALHELASWPTPHRVAATPDVRRRGVPAGCSSSGRGPVNLLPALKRLAADRAGASHSPDGAGHDRGRRRDAVARSHRWSRQIRPRAVT